MFVLGIDPGLTTTGFGLVRSGRVPTAVAAGVIRTDPGVPLPRRLRELHDGVAGLLAEHRPDVVALEMVFTNRNRQTAIAVGRASGVAILAAGTAGVPVVEYTPTTVKSAVAGDGAAGKKAVQLMVAKRLGLAAFPKPVDAADALAVALCYLQTVRLGAAS